MKRMRYGPFRVRIDRLVQGVVFVLLAAGLLVFGARNTTIDCTRADAVSCRLGSWPLGTSGAAFEPKQVEVSRRRTSGKQDRVSEYGRIVFTDHSGKQHASIETDYADALESGRELQRFLAQPGGRQLRIDVHGSRWTFVFGLLVLGLSLSWIRFALHGCRSVSLELSVDRQTLHVRRSFARVLDIDLASVTGVSIEWGVIKDFWRGRGSPIEQGGRLCLETNNGVIPLLPSFSRGRDVHFAAAKRLRSLLGLAEQHARDSVPEQPPRYASRTISGALGAVWVGACCGAVGGIALGVLGAWILGDHQPSEPAGGPWYFAGLIGGVPTGVAVALLFERRDRSRD